VGKSTLLNALVGGCRQQTGAVRERDGRGTHTTRHRELFHLPDAGLIIDTPGMRALRVWGEDGLAGFGDIDALANDCRFRDCQHHEEPGCAVLAAIEAGELPTARLRAYQKLGRELDGQRRRQSVRARMDERRSQKAFSRSIRARQKQNMRNGREPW
jgi:ribosome biogenesis GTPase